ncbi:hypothetical protein DdX_17531 [Ditylenchus destructor]|uniref:Uncharacterized protein n=1 Tax=Ditylenchus destructor TaxID=166010 RepID=A0AAD4QZ31_9BILA|nr:hypothetical protein DdX_17531 [Ditylenchus destructor]
MKNYLLDHEIQTGTTDISQILKRRDTLKTSNKVPCYSVNGTRTEDELYTVDLTSTLFSEMVQVETPRCAHINYAAAFPKAYRMKWALRVFSAFHDPDTNAKVMKAGEHIARCPKSKVA